MSAPALAGVERPTLSIRGTAYPVLLPSLRDPRLHLASVIVSLQVLGQVAFDFGLSIAQILIALSTSAAIEFAIAFRRQRVIMWPASALLTGNGVAFVLRVPGTPHGDWWSTKGWWIFAGTAAVSILSKHVIRYRGGHVFNPSNAGLVLCFLALGERRAEPLDFWWGPMSAWLALALVIIVAGGLTILSRLGLLAIAVGFWLAFAAGIGVLALTSHAMTARWHLGPITGEYFWRVLVLSPEVLVFLFFMITDPKTIPAGGRARRVYAVSVGLLAALLIAPAGTEFWSKVALLGALAIVCAARPLGDLLGARIVPAPSRRDGRGLAGAAVVGLAVYAGILIAAGLPARSGSAAVAPLLDTAHMPAVTVLHSTGVATQLDRRTATAIARSLVADLGAEADALRTRDARRAAAAAQGSRLDGIRKRIAAARTTAIGVPTYSIAGVALRLERGAGQGPPVIVAAIRGSSQLTTYSPPPVKLTMRDRPVSFSSTLLLTFERGRYLITGERGTHVQTPAVPTVPVRRAPATTPAVRADFGSVHLRNVAGQVGLAFRQGSFRFGRSYDPEAMMGGGVCWLDYDNDGWLDLFAVNSYSTADTQAWERHGGLPRSQLFHNVHGRFVNVSKGSGASLPLRGNGCVAADFNGDGYTDLYETTTSSDVLFWNNGNGTFTEGARAAGIASFGWRTGAAVTDVDGDGRPDLFVAGYANLGAPIPSSAAGFPTNYQGVRDLLFLNEGLDAHGHSRFREVGRQVGLDRRSEHGLGAVFTDVNGDGRPDLYVANDEDPNRLYLNLPAPGGLGFRFVESARRDGVADTNAGMGIASGDYSGDGDADLFVTNSRGQTHALYRRTPTESGGPAFADVRSVVTRVFGTNSTGWGASWVDLNRDGSLDLALANGGIPVTNLARDAGQIQVLDNLSAREPAQGQSGAFGAATGLLGLGRSPLVNGRGLAAADFDNDGNVDLAVNTIGGRLVLLRNTNTSGHWLEVGLRAFRPNTVVTAILPDGRRLVRESHAGSSYLSSEDPRLFFGLGGATRVARLVVRYPDGAVTTLTNVRTDRIITVGR